ncbi:unnamed protein product [Adineta steineri]|uniref:Uncharacterized protein n=1 Tax=Adineta steineri TaxID=433720 RepID=A0A813QWU0_9BILA|nr:unnamed protein product [Adineta steineri]
MMKDVLEQDVEDEPLSVLLTAAAPAVSSAGLAHVVAGAKTTLQCLTSDIFHNDVVKVFDKDVEHEPSLVPYFYHVPTDAAAVVVVVPTPAGIVLLALLSLVGVLPVVVVAMPAGDLLRFLLAAPDVVVALAGAPLPALPFAARVVAAAVGWPLVIVVAAADIPVVVVVRPAGGAKM